MDKGSLKSSNIRGRFFHLVGGKGDFRNGVHPFMHGTTLPVPIFLGLHFVRAGKDADGLVHALHCDPELYPVLLWLPTGEFGTLLVAQVEFDPAGKCGRLSVRENNAARLGKRNILPNRSGEGRNRAENLAVGFVPGV